MTFAQIIHPITIEDFFENYYEKKPLHIKRDQADYYHQFLSPEEIDGYVQLKGTFVPNSKVAYQGKEVSPAMFSKEISKVGPYNTDPEKMIQLYDKGYTIKFDKLHQTYPPVAKKVSDLEQEIGLKIRTSLYVTPPNSQGYGIHTDSHDVLALQINGTKMWKVKQAEISLPSNYKSVEVNWEEGVQIISISAGDFFYCPRGLAHDVYTEAQSSTHFTLGFKPVYGYNLFETLSGLAYQKEFFRKAQPNNFTSPQDRIEYFNSWKKEVLKLVEDLDLKSFDQSAQLGVIPSQINQKDGAFLSRFYEFAPDDLLIFNDKGWEIQKDKMTIKLMRNGKHFNVPISVEKLILEIMKGKAIAFSNLQSGLPETQNTKLIKRLVLIGFIKKA